LRETRWQRVIISGSPGFGSYSALRSTDPDKTGWQDVGITSSSLAETGKKKTTGHCCSILEAPKKVPDNMPYQCSHCGMTFLATTLIFLCQLMAL